jgi:hypothetical protein
VIAEVAFDSESGGNRLLLAREQVGGHLGKVDVVESDILQELQREPRLNEAALRAAVKAAAE